MTYTSLKLYSSSFEGSMQSVMGTTFSCLKCLKSLISLSVRFASTTFSNAFVIFLIATFVFCFSSFAEQTMPYAPLPIGLIGTYFFFTSNRFPQTTNFVNSYGSSPSSCSSSSRSLLFVLFDIIFFSLLLLLLVVVVVSSAPRLLGVGVEVNDTLFSLSFRRLTFDTFFFRRNASFTLSSSSVSSSSSSSSELLSSSLLMSPSSFLFCFSSSSLDDAAPSPLCSLRNSKCS
mmetsp:Transcript_7548/g.24948  ORF Transcript_7548/g.24948 Transcript_7548/m.24948 type:complete len:231 (+) Transcript_7548:940-1632(+)